MSNPLAALLELLQCPACGMHPLTLVAEPYPDKLPFPSGRQHLACPNCAHKYPVTTDDIPVMWSDSLREGFLSTAEDSNIGANLKVYDAISDDYQSYTRQLPENALRIRDGAKRILAQAGAELPVMHLDFGCGPGQVLGWLADMGLTSVGLDVSLVNLRNTRKATGALVVCGDATQMPFRPDLFHLVTEASVLHHIFEWESVVSEACRVCKPGGGVLLDAEPSREMVAFSKLAVFVFNLRFPVYKLLSYVWKSKYIFRDTEQAKLNLLAEVHHQPGTGFPLARLAELFTQAGCTLRVYHSPGADLDTTRPPKLKNVILNLLSFRNPWNPRYGSFTAIGRKDQPEEKEGTAL